MTLITVSAAAKRLGIGYSTLKQWIYTGKVRTTTTPGGHHRISEDEITRLMARSQPDVRRPSKREAASGVLVSLSGRNKLRGFVDEVRVDGLLAQVRLRIGGQSLIAVITSDAIAELKLKRGDDAIAIIKATEVMVAKELPAPPVTRRRKR